MEFKSGDPDKLTKAQQEDYLRRYETNLPYINQQAHYFSRKYNQYDKFDDFVQEGCIALISAVKGFDPTRGVPFLSYFMYWVHLRMKTFCLSNMYCIRVPERQLKKFEQYKKMKVDGKSDEEIAAILKTKVDSLIVVINNIRCAQVVSFTDLSLERSWSENHKAEDATDLMMALNLHPMYDSANSVEEVAEEKICLKEYNSLFEMCLDEFELALVKRHFGFDGESISLNKLRHELPRAGKVVSRERLRQKKDKALDKIKYMLDIHTGAASGADAVSAEPTEGDANVTSQI